MGTRDKWAYERKKELRLSNYNTYWKHQKRNVGSKILGGLRESGELIF